LLRKAQGFAAFPIINGANFSEPLALEVNAYVSLCFLPLTPESFLSASPQSGGNLVQ
jgi:hypothetical protein